MEIKKIEKVEMKRIMEMKEKKQCKRQVMQENNICLSMFVICYIFVNK